LNMLTEGEISEFLIENGISYIRRVK